MDASAAELPQTFYKFIYNIAPLLRTIDHTRQFILRHDPMSTTACVVIWILACLDQSWFAFVFTVVAAVVVFQILAHRHQQPVTVMTSAQKALKTMLRMNRLLRSCNIMFDALGRVNAWNVPAILALSFLTLTFVSLRWIFLLSGIVLLTWHLDLPQKLAMTFLVRLMLLLKQLDQKLDEIRGKHSTTVSTHSLVPVTATSESKPSTTLIKQRRVWYHEVFQVGYGWIPYDSPVDRRFIGDFTYGYYNNYGKWFEVPRMQAWARRAPLNHKLLQ